jgi:hypothetical protein
LSLTIDKDNSSVGTSDIFVTNNYKKNIIKYVF